MSFLSSFSFCLTHPRSELNILETEILMVQTKNNPNKNLLSLVSQGSAQQDGKLSDDNQSFPTITCKKNVAPLPPWPAKARKEPVFHPHKTVTRDPITPTRVPSQRSGRKPGLPPPPGRTDHCSLPTRVMLEEPREVGRDLHHRQVVTRPPPLWQRPCGGTELPPPSSATKMCFPLVMRRSTWGLLPTPVSNVIAPSPSLAQAISENNSQDRRFIHDPECHSII